MRPNLDQHSAIAVLHASPVEVFSPFGGSGQTFVEVSVARAFTLGGESQGRP